MDHNPAASVKRLQELARKYVPEGVSLVDELIEDRCREVGVTQTREIRCGLGHAGHNGPPIAHFGLGKHAKADVVVRWPDRAGTKTEVGAVEAGQRLVVRQ